MFFFITYKNEYYLTQIYYDIFLETLEVNNKIGNDFLKIDNIKNYKFIKCETNSKYNIAIIFLPNLDNYVYFYRFYINTKNDGIFYSGTKLAVQFRNESYGINIRYLRETKEVVFSCLNTNGEIYSLLFDEEMKHGPIYRIFSVCESVYGYSLLYLPNISDYYVISDVICNGNKYPFISLFNDDFIKIINSSDITLVENNTYNSPYNIGYNNTSNNDCSVEDFLNKECLFNNSKAISTQDFILNISSKLKDISLYNILNNITNEYKEDIIIDGNNIIYEITSSYNQNNKEYKNISTIDLGECEKILKRQYKIDDNETLLIFKIDYFIEGLKTRLIKYDIFHPKTKEQLDMKYCQNSTIKMNIPVIIDEDELFKYDPSNDFYNDKCSPYTSDHGTDMTLYDRKNEFNKNNMSLCTMGCIFDGYNSETKKVICECKADSNLTLSSLLQSIINNEDIIHRFIGIKKTANLGVIDCYKLLFKKEGLINNIGSYILMLIILIFISSCFIFYFNGAKYINNTIANIIKIKKETKQNGENKINKNIKRNKNSKIVYNAFSKKKEKEKRIKKEKRKK